MSDNLTSRTSPVRLCWLCCVLFIGVASQTTKPPVACDTVCSCAMTNTGFSVDCRNKALTEVPLAINTSAAIVLLSSNKLSMLEKGAFNWLWQLETLYLQQNEIADIQPGTFDRMYKLKTLILNSNRLTYIGNGFFRHLASLSQIDLSNNLITTINRYAFFALPDLSVINLGGNALVCECEEKFLKEWLTLRANQLTVISGQCSNLNYQHLTVVPDGQFPACSGTSLFETDLKCYQCSDAAGIHDCKDSGTETTCQGPADVCYTTIDYSDNHLGVSGGCKDYVTCLALEADNPAGCTAEDPLDTECTFCTPDFLSNKRGTSSTVKQFDTLVILTLDLDLTPALQDTGSAEHINFVQNVINEMQSRLYSQKGAFITAIEELREPRVTVVAITRCSSIWYVNKVMVRDTMRQVLDGGTIGGAPVIGVEITLIGDYSCRPQVIRDDIYGVFRWPEANVGTTAGIPCPFQLETGPSVAATRECVAHDNDTVSWSAPDIAACPRASEISRDLQELSGTKVTDDNVGEVSTNISRLSEDWSEYQDADVDWTVTIIEEILTTTPSSTDAEVIRNTLLTANNLLNIATDVLAAGHSAYNSSSRLLTAVDVLLEGVDVSSGDFSDVRDNIAGFSMGVAPSAFSGLTMSALGDDDGPLRGDKFTVEKAGGDISSGHTGISIPATILDGLPRRRRQNVDKVALTMYRDANLFASITHVTLGNDVAKEIVTDNNVTVIARRQINSRVIGASVPNNMINNLEAPVNITLRHKKNATNPECVFWDTEAELWSTEGCVLTSTDEKQTTCSCNHLTNFALLMDVYATGAGLSEENKLALSIISYVGCGVSLAAMILTLVTYTCFKKLRRDNPSKILMNLCLTIALADLVFVAGMQGYTIHSFAGCKLVAVLLHYFLLAMMSWMLVEAFYMYLSLIKVFNAHVERFQLKSSVFGWGIPLVIVVITLGVNKTDNYGLQPGNICWLSRIPFYVAFLAPVCITIILNSVCFIFVMRQIIRRSSSKLTKTERSSTAIRLRGAVSVVVLLGLTWIFAIFAVGDFGVVFHYLFAIFNSLQGLFIFIFYCFLKKDVKKMWRKSVPFLKSPYEQGASSSSNSKGYSDTTFNKTTKNKEKENSERSNDTSDTLVSTETRTMFRGRWQMAASEPKSSNA